MRKYAVVLLPVLLALVALCRPPLPGAEAPSSVGRQLAPFTLSDPRDRAIIKFADLRESKAVVVVFLGTECPVSNAFLPVLAELHKTYGPRGVAFLAINSNQQDGPERVAVHARRQQVPFPVLKDPGNAVADAFGARRTPEAFLLSPTGVVLYQGRIDDQFGVGYARPGKPSRRDLAEALDEVLAGKAVSTPTTPVGGCLIGRKQEPKAQGAVTWTKHVSRIVQKNCQECHRPGAIGPMPLVTYEDAVNWSETIREVVSEGRMPPWLADPRFGHFRNDRRLTTEERDTLLAWLDGGLAKGDERDLPSPRAFPDGWRIGKPDVVFTMPEPFDVPATAPKGGVPYKYFIVPTDFEEDRWVVAAETKAGTPSVVHHILVFVVPKGQLLQPERPDAVLAGEAPGEMPLALEGGLAKKVPAGARLVFQMHYTPDGQPHKDQSSVGIVFAKEPPKHRVSTYPVLNFRFIGREIKIPAGAEDVVIESEFRFRRDAHLLHFMPHMHLRGKSFRYDAEYPDGRTETLLSVPRYNFNWQTLYRCKEPLAMPKGTRLHCVAHYDNSAKNPSNPDPTIDVYWGDQTWEEMMVGWIDYYNDDEKP